jgi:hypothetical protein
MMMPEFSHRSMLMTDFSDRSMSMAEFSDRSMLMAKFSVTHAYCMRACVTLGLCVSAPGVGKSADCGPKSIYYIEENADVVVVRTDISFKICNGKKLASRQSIDIS